MNDYGVTQVTLRTGGKKQMQNAQEITEFSTTATVREAIEKYAEEPVILVIPIGGDGSEFE